MSRKKKAEQEKPSVTDSFSTTKTFMTIEELAFEMLQALNRLASLSDEGRKDLYQVFNSISLPSV